jgi:hypothetical protein
MLLGLVEQQQVPSARKYLARHADRVYRLTTAGVAAAEIATDEARFTSFVVDAVLAAHPSFRRFVLELERSPLVIPVIDISDVERARESKSLMPLATQAAEEINSMADTTATPERVLGAMRSWSARRFAGRPADDPPSRKARAEVFSDACAAVALDARGIGAGPSDLKNLRAWGSNFRISDQSRYTEGRVGPFVVWLAADLVRRSSSTLVGSAGTALTMSLGATAATAPDGASLHLVRRGFVAHRDAVGGAVISAYFHQAADVVLEAPYLPIHSVRAEAAFRCGVVRALVDRVIEGLVDGTISRPNVRVQLRIGSDGDHPDSEPVYSRGGSPRYSMSVAQQGTNTPGDKV